MASAATDIQPSRKRVLVRGTLFTANGAADVWIRDISATGARVTSKDRIPARGDVVLKRGPVFVAANIASSNEDGAELGFYRALSEDDIYAAAVADRG